MSDPPKPRCDIDIWTTGHAMCICSARVTPRADHQRFGFRARLQREGLPWESDATHVLSHRHVRHKGPRIAKHHDLRWDAVVRNIMLPSREEWVRSLWSGLQELRLDFQVSEWEGS